MPSLRRRTGLSGSEYWAGLKRHPAVVNPVGRAASPDVLSLAGEWEFTTFPHGSGKRIWLKVGRVGYFGLKIRATVEGETVELASPLR